MSDRFEDHRGVIQDLLAGPIDCVTRIETSKGAIRGNHVHKLTHQWTLILDGVLRVMTRGPDGVTHEKAYYPGEMAYEPPGVAHAWEALLDCVVLVFTRGPRSGQNYESDTYREGIHLL